MMENVDSKIDRILTKEGAAMPARRVDNYQTRRIPAAQIQVQPTQTPARQLTAQDCSYYETYDMR